MLGLGSKWLRDWDKLLKMFSYKRERFHPVSHPPSSESTGDGEYFDRNLNRPVARKRLQNDSPNSPKQLQRMIHEARLLSYLDHPGIVPFYDASVESDGTFSCTAKWIQGKTLSTLLEPHPNVRKALPLSRVLSIFTKLCETMSYAHHKGVLHLDLKPENIIVGEYGEVFVLGWNYARLYDPKRYAAYLRDLGQPEEPFDLQDQLLYNGGTLPYLPPEQLTQPRHQITPAADIFSAGVMLYWMLTGSFPYSCERQNLQAYAVALQQTQVRPPQSLRGDISPSLSNICLSMLQKEPERRPSHFGHILQELYALSDTGTHFTVRFFQEGETIFREGEPGYEALYIIEGLVEISALHHGRPKVLALRGSGDIIDELTVLSGLPRKTTATTRAPTIARILTKSTIEQELEKVTPWLSKMVHNLSHKFVETSPENHENLPPPTTNAENPTPSK